MMEHGIWIIEVRCHRNPLYYLNVHENAEFLAIREVFGDVALVGLAQAFISK